MALCSNCGGVVTAVMDLPADMLVSEEELQVMCLTCGQPKMQLCVACHGSGFVAVPSFFQKHCSHCGHKIEQTTHTTCMCCNGGGYIEHACVKRV